MNINRLNLNLIFTFDAMLSERNVSKAAEKRFITQSAMSNSLNQLRELFNDPLFVRSPDGMQPTAKALELEPQVKTVIQEVGHLFSQSTVFDPKTSTRIFHIGISDYAEFCLLPGLLKRCGREAPNIELRMQHLNHVTSISDFKENEIELALGVLVEKHTPQLVVEKLFDMGGVIAARKGHPLFKKRVTLKQYLSAKHMRIIYQSRRTITATDEALKKMGKKRDVIVSLPHILPALFALKDTNLIVTLPDFISPSMAKTLNLAVQPAPFDLRGAKTYAVWQKRDDSDVGLTWLRQLISEIAKSI